MPFLTAGADIGYRQVQYDGTTSLSGDVIVQDVQKEDQTYARQLIFMSMKGVIQSEVRLVNSRLLFIYIVFFLLFAFFFLISSPH